MFRYGEKFENDSFGQKNESKWNLVNGNLFLWIYVRNIKF